MDEHKKQKLGHLNGFGLESPQNIQMGKPGTTSGIIPLPAQRAALAFSSHSKLVSKEQVPSLPAYLDTKENGEIQKESVSLLRAQKSSQNKDNGTPTPNKRTSSALSSSPFTPPVLIPTKQLLATPIKPKFVAHTDRNANCEVQKSSVSLNTAQKQSQGKENCTPKPNKRTNAALLSSPIAPPVLLSTKELRLSTPIEPAHKRFAHLVSKQHVPSVAPLPKHFKVLERLFYGLETVIDFVTGRGDPAIFHKLRKFVEQQADHDFTLKHFAQILTIYPDCYNITPLRLSINDKFEDTFLIKLPVSIRDRVEAVEGMQDELLVKTVTYTHKLNCFETFSAVERQAKESKSRRFQFSKNLADVVKLKHQVYNFSLLGLLGTQWFAT